MKRLFIIIFILTSLIIGFLFVFNFYFVENIFNNSTGIINNETKLVNHNEVGNVNIEKSNNRELISCYDAINSLLEKDGFTYLEGTKWSRGDNNFFIFDLVTREFHVAEYSATADMPEDWYEEFYNTYISYVYSYDTQNLVMSQNIIYGNIYNLKEDDYTFFPEELKNTDIFYHEIPIWMNYYVDQFENYGCSIKGKFNEDILNAFKTRTSKVITGDIISVFDLKSEDNIIRYFNDVHVSGDVKDNPRYKELEDVDDFYELKKEEGTDFDVWVSILNSDNNKVFETDSRELQASVIEEFIKDVAYKFIPEKNDKNFNQTIAIYFVDVDNTNGNFKYIYKKPVRGVPESDDPNVISFDFRELNMPYQGTIIGTRRDHTSLYSYVPYSDHSISNVLGEFIKAIVFVDSTIEFSDNFIRNYTRPFAYGWQKQMGLTKLFDEKYGFIDHSIKYIN